MKYGDAALARKYSHVRDYVRFNQAAVREMHPQVGDLVLGDQGIARRGLLVRHLVLPDGIAGTAAVLKFLAEEIHPTRTSTSWTSTVPVIGRAIFRS